MFSQPQTPGVRLGGNLQGPADWVQEKAREVEKTCHHGHVGRTGDCLSLQEATQTRASRICIWERALPEPCPGKRMRLMRPRGEEAQQRSIAGVAPLPGLGLGQIWSVCVSMTFLI